jgi:hypothetical protein
MPTDQRDLEEEPQNAVASPAPEDVEAQEPSPGELPSKPQSVHIAQAWPQQARTTTWADDPAERRKQAMGETERRLAAHFKEQNPYTFSSFDMPKVPASFYAHGVAQAEQEYQQQRRDQQAKAQGEAYNQRLQQRQALDEYNSGQLAQYKGSGQQYYTDPASGRIVPVKDESGRELYHKTPWEVGTHPKTGEPTLSMRDQFGQRQYKELPLVPSLDPSEGKMYYKLPDGTTQPAGDIDSFLSHPNYNVARTAWRAKMDFLKESHKQAMAPMREIVSSAQVQLNTANAQLDGLNEQIDQVKNERDMASGDEAKYAGLNARVEQLQTQADTLKQSVSPKGQLGRMYDAAQKHLSIADAQARYELYQAQADARRRQLKEEGKPEEGDQTLASNMAAMQAITPQLQQAKEKVGIAPEDTPAQEGGEPSIQLPQVPEKAPSALESSEPFALLKQGVKGIGDVPMAEFARRYGDGRGNPTPASVIRMKNRSSEIDGILSQEGEQNLSGEVRKGLTDEKTFLDQLALQRLARMTPDQQKRVVDATRDPTLVEKAKDLALTAAGGFNKGLIDAGAGIARTLVPGGPLAAPGGGIDQAKEYLTNAFTGAKASESPEVQAKMENPMTPFGVAHMLAETAGGMGSVVAPGAAAGRIAQAAGLSGEAANALARLTGVVGGGAQGGESMREGAIRTLQPQVQAGTLKRDDFMRSVGLATIVGDLIGGGSMEVGPFANFAQRMGGLNAGKSFLSSLLDKAGSKGTNGALRWLAGDAGQKGLAAVAREGMQGGGVGWLQSIANDLGAKATYDPEHGVNFKQAGETGGQMGIVSLLLGGLSHAQLPVPEGKAKGGLSKEQQAKLDARAAEAKMPAEAPAEPAEPFQTKGEPSTAEQAAEVIDRGLNEKGETLPVKPAAESAKVFTEAEKAEQEKAAGEAKVESNKEGRVQSLIDELSAGDDQTRRKIVDSRKGHTTDDFLEALEAAADAKRGRKAPTAEDIAQAGKERGEKPITAETPGVQQAGRETPTEAKTALDTLAEGQGERAAAGMAGVTPEELAARRAGAEMMGKVPQEVPAEKPVAEESKPVSHTDARDVLLKLGRKPEDVARMTDEQAQAELKEHANKGAEKPELTPDEAARQVHKAQTEGILLKDELTPKPAEPEKISAQPQPKPEEKSNGPVRQQKPGKIPVRQAPENSEGVRQENAVDQGAAGARRAERAGGESAARSAGEPAPGEAGAPQGKEAVREKVRGGNASDRFNALVGGGSRAEAEEIVSRMSDAEAEKAYERINNAEPGSADHSEMALQVLEGRVKAIRDNKGIIARSAPKPRADIDNGTRYTEWRVRKITAEDLQSNSSLRERSSVGDYVAERRTVKTDGSKVEPGEWEPQEGSPTKRGAIEAAWEPEMMKAESLDSTHKAVVDAENTRHEAEVAKAKEENRVLAENRAKQGEYAESVRATKLPPGKQKEITLKWKDKDGNAVEKKVPAMIFGDWAIWKDDSSKQSEYNVTHVPSGMRAQGRETLGGAREVVQALIHSGADVSSPDIKSDTATMKKLAQSIQGMNESGTAPDWFRGKAEKPAAKADSKEAGLPDVDSFTDSRGVEYYRKNGVWVDKNPKQGGRITDPKAIDRLNNEILAGPSASTEPAAAPTPASEPKLPSQMNQSERLAELEANGVKELNGKPLEETNPAEQMNAIGKLRRGQLTEGTSSTPRLSDRAIEALKAAKIQKPGMTSAATPLSVAWDGAIDVAIAGIKAGRTIADVVKLAVARMRALHPDATPEDITRISDKIREIHSSVFGEGPEGGGGKAAKPVSASEEKVVTTLSKPGVLDEIKSVVAPQTRSADARTAAGVLREHGAELANRYDRAEAALSDAHKHLDSLPEKSRYDFIHAIETGEKQADPKLQKFADTMREMLDSRRDEVQGLGTGALENFIKDYFPHIWEDPEKANLAFQSAAAKRPMEGTRGFLKQRTIPTTREGLELGLKPVSSNPVDLTMLKIREMDKYILAHKYVRGEMADKGFVVPFSPSEEKPMGWTKINDQIATVFGPRTGAVKLPEAAKEAGVKPGDVGVYGRRIMAEYYAPDAVANVINNYLSPGLRKYKIFRGYLSLANTLNQFQLGASAFHLGFTSFDAANSQLAAGIEDLYHKDVAGAAKTFLGVPTAPFTTSSLGRKIQQEMIRPGTHGGEIARLADAAVAAGARAKMDRFYQTTIANKMMENFRQGGPLNYLKGAARSPLAAIETMSKPIMEHIVPWQKLGVFGELARRDLARLPEDATRDDVRKVMGKAWDSVDNRLGQMVYDNQFWNKMAKDMAQASVRSVGWNVGTIRELGGGALDTIQQAKNLATGKDTELTHRMAYMIAMPVITGMLGGVTHYLLTGKAPEEQKDYFFPKTGEKDAQGRDIRLSMPSYMKDVYHYSHDPVGTVAGKMHPALGAIKDMLQNKDYFDRPIRNTDDPIFKQIVDVSKFAGKQFGPIGIMQAKQAYENRQAPAETAANFIGVTRAPKWVSMTEAEQLADKLNQSHQGTGSVPTAGGQYQYDAKRNLAGALRNGTGAERAKALTELHGLVSAGQLTEAAANRLVKGSKNAYLVNSMVHLDANEAMRVYRASDPEERRIIREVVNQKVTRSHLTGEDKKALLDQMRQLDKAK